MSPPGGRKWFMQHWLQVVLLGLMLTLSGCIQAIDDGNETADNEDEAPPAPVQRSAAQAHDCSVDTPTLPLGDEPVCEKYEIDVPAAVFEILFELQWHTDTNSYSLQVDTPTGQRLSAETADDREITLKVTDVDPGTYTFWARAESVAFADELELLVTYHWMETAGVEVELPEPTIQVERQGDRWRATIHYVAVGEVADRATLAVRTINGNVDLSATQNAESRIDMEAFAWAQSEDRARELVRAIEVSVDVTSTRLRAEVDQQPRQLQNNEGVGADVAVETNAIVDGSAATTNGDIDFDQLPFDDLSVSSTNGGFDGELIGYGDLTGSTTNGGFDIALTPKESLTIGLSTTNGGSDIELKEGSDIGYRLRAKTTNGDVTEDMQDASLEGEDNDATLETTDYGGRSIKVAGAISSTNGSIHFDGV